MIFLSCCLIACMVALGAFAIWREAQSSRPNDETPGITQDTSDTTDDSINSESDPVSDLVTDPETDPESDLVTNPETDPESDVVTNPESDLVTDPETDVVTDSDTDSLLENWPKFNLLEKVDSWYATPTNPQIPAEDAPEYVAVVKRPTGNEHRVYNDFFTAGVACTVQYEINLLKDYGEVISVEFDGYETEEYYYVRLGTSAVLHVSLAQGNEYINDYVKKVFYLTFDDGPSGNTGTILSILAKYNVKATFYTVGFSLENYPKNVRRIIEQGHVMGCHSYTHVLPYIYGSTDHFLDELLQWETRINTIMGGMVPYRVFRYPGGTTSGSIKKAFLQESLALLDELGYGVADWTCGNNDEWFGMMEENQTKEEYLKASLMSTVASVSRTSKPRVCLMHETSEYTCEMLEWAINYLIDQGYVFRTTDLLQENVYLGA